MVKYNVDIQRLCKDINVSRKAMQRLRENRKMMVMEMAGDRWSENAADKPVMINLISMYCQIVGRSLIAQTPRVMMSTFETDQKPAVSALNTWANKEIGRMSLAQTLQRAVLDALFHIAIVKVGIATPAQSAMSAWNLQAGQPFAMCVDLDDAVVDMRARDWQNLGYIGHRYRASLEVVKNDKNFTKARKDLQPSIDPAYNKDGDERISMLGRTYYGFNSEEYEDKVDLWEIFCPAHRKVYTLAGDAAGIADEEPLREQDYIGPEEGPYVVLGMQWVPGNLMPKGPIMDLYNLHYSVNGLYRKADRQGYRQKVVTFVSGVADADGNVVMNANDGEVIKVNDPDKIKQVPMGGADPGNLQLAMHMHEMFDKNAGNLSLLGGLGPQSKTATQDTMLNQNAGAGVGAMQDATIRFTTDVISRLTWYWWHDPLRIMETTWPEGGGEYSIKRHLYPAGYTHFMGKQINTRDGKMPDIKIDPYSLQHQTPQTRIAAINQIVTQIYTPMAQLFQAQGVQFDLQSYIKLAAKYLDQPDLQDIFTIAEPTPMDQGQSPDTGRMPTETTRNYVRRSIGQDTPANRNNDFSNFLAKSASANGTGA